MTLQLRRPSLAALAVIAAVLVLDQVTKAFVVAATDRLPATVFGGIRLEIVRNTGVSFSLFSGRGWLVTLLVGLVILMLLTLFLALPRRYSLPLALLLGGSIGNLIDRFRYGYVVDYVAIYWWPRFNVADIAIIVGAVLMVLMVMLHPAARATPVEGGGAARFGDDTPADDSSGGPGTWAVPPGRPGENAAASAEPSAPPSTEPERGTARGPAEP